MKRLQLLLLYLILGLMILWGVAALYYSSLEPPLSTLVAGMFAFTACCLLFVRQRKKGVSVFLLLFGVVLLFWFSMEPSNQRDWQQDVAVLPYAEVKGDEIKVYNIRNTDYRTETDYTLHYDDRVYDLRKLRSLDLFISDWGLKTIVHTLVSFGFENGEYLCISIETRKEVGESYSSVRGFFRQYELIYVVADERDLVRLRTNYRRGETVYLYRLKVRSVEVLQKVFLDYLYYINRLYNQPEWYNALTGNCTTEIRGHTRPYAGKVRWDWRILANGYVDELIYEHEAMDTSLPFAELKKKSIINEKALKADGDSEFSRLIREGLPGMDV